MKPAKLCFNNLIQILLSIMFGISFSFQAFSQDNNETEETDAPAFEKIEVTAQKRTQSIQDIGVSLTAVTGDQIQKQALSDSVDLLQGVTNLDIKMTAGSTNANIFVRGIGTTGVGFNVQSGVGVYSDEVSLNSPVVNILQLFDLERVEVLRGPQNTLYGRNTTGGAINYVSKKPEIGADAHGYVNTTAGRFGEINLEGAFGTSLGDDAAMRISVLSQQRDGIRTNLNDGRENMDRDKLAVRAQVLFEPSSDSSVLLKAHAEEVNSDNSRRKMGGPFDPNNPGAPCSTPYVFGQCADGNGFVGPSDWLEIDQDMIRPDNAVEAFGASATINIDFEDFTFTSITAYEENEASLSEDNDASPAHDFHFYIESEADQFSQEFRLTSDDNSDIRWILGAYGFWENKTGTTGPTFATPMGIMLVRSNAEFDSTSYSIYGEAEYDVADNTTLIAGARFGTDKVEGETIALFAFESQLGGLDIATPSRTGDPLPSFDALLAAATASGARVLRVGGDSDPDAKINNFSWSEWGGKLGVNHKLNKDTLLYGSWARGYKAGVFPNAPMAIALGLGDTPFNPEIVDTFEVGAKTELADGAVRLNGAVFVTDYQDQQISQFVNGEFTVVSVDSELTGAEVDLNWQATEDLRIDAGIAVLDSEITDTIDESQIGNELISAPGLTGRLSATRFWALEDNTQFSVSGEIRYTGSRFYGLSNFIEEDSYTVVNLNAYYEFGDDLEYRFGFWVKNAMDEEYFLGRDVSTNYHSIVLSEPRTFGINFNYMFE